jgi:outer membrane protein insertion porin family
MYKLDTPTGSPEVITGAFMHTRSSTLVSVLLLSLFTATPLLGGPPLIRSIDFQGASVFTSRDFLSWLGSKQTLPYSRSLVESDLGIIVDNYRRQGYLAARVDSVQVRYTSDSAFVDLAFLITEGKRAVVGSIAIEGAWQMRPSDILGQFDIKSGEPLDESALERDIDALLSRYERIGYPFAACHVANLGARSGGEEDTLDITLRVEEGRQITIDEIRVEGNKETDASVVVRETRLVPGEVFNPGKVDAIKQRLTRLNIFARVDDPQLYMRNSTAGLLITVQEGSTNTFDGVIGYIPASTEGESGYLTGLVSVAMRNLLGTGRKFSLQWQREDKRSQELGVRYLEPWVLGMPANLGIGFLQRQQDSSYVRRVFDMKAELMLSEELSVGALVGLESVIPSADSTVNRVFRSSTTTVGVELQYDSRNDLYSPTTGARYRTDYNYGAKRIKDVPSPFSSQVATKVAVQKFSLDLDFYLSTFSHQVSAVGFHGREIRSGQLEEGEMFRFGGARTLRGYRENQFLGSRIAWSNLEYRFLLGRRSFFFGFVDTGYYSRPADPVHSIAGVDAFKYGYGVGMQLETGLGTLGVSFALGKGDSFSAGKIHLGLINEF